MINDMDYHVRAWHRILIDLGATISLAKTKEECYGKNSELLERIFPGRFSDDEKNKMGFAKEQQYQADFKPHLKLIDGLHHFLHKAHSIGVKTAIGSAAILYNIDFVLDGLHLRNYFDAIVSADDVAFSKPHPETFLKCAGQLSVLPVDCLVFEDAPKGVEAAANAAMDCMVITTMHSKTDFEPFNNIIAFIEDYTDPLLKQLI